MNILKWPTAVAASLALVLGANAAGASEYGDYLQSHYSAAEQRCLTLGDADAGWCFVAATKARDQRIAREVTATRDASEIAYQRAWIKYRAAHCDAIAGTTGSGAGTIMAECMLDMAIARELELEADASI